VKIEVDMLEHLPLMCATNRLWLNRRKENRKFGKDYSILKTVKELHIECTPEANFNAKSEFFKKQENLEKLFIHERGQKKVVSHLTRAAGIPSKVLTEIYLDSPSTMDWSEF
jgi:hypothetical protein